jgi:hypothetical protein
VYKTRGRKRVNEGNQFSSKLVFITPTIETVNYSIVPIIRVGNLKEYVRALRFETLRRSSHRERESEERERERREMCPMATHIPTCLYLAPNLRQWNGGWQTVAARDPN